jgi:hypothetical protein
MTILYKQHLSFILCRNMLGTFTIFVQGIFDVMFNIKILKQEFTLDFLFFKLQNLIITKPLLVMIMKP